MRTPLPLVAALLSFALLAPGPADATTLVPTTTAPLNGGLALKRVLLSTGGVGYFEYEAETIDDTPLTLTVLRDQVDDILKSVVVRDSAGGIGAISLAGEAPAETVFRDLPFPQDALRSPAALLAALKGAEIKVTGNRAVAGRLLSVAEEIPATQPDGGPVFPRTRVSILTATGIVQFILEEAETVSFTNPTLDEQVHRALDAMTAFANSNQRTLTITVAGHGTHTVRVGYVAAAPLWKATYRLTLPVDGPSDGKIGALQGWAVLENLSGETWSGVDLTLVSGAPVTFRQNLYAAAFVDRPLVPVEVMGRVIPEPDERALAPTPPATNAPTDAVPAPSPAMERAPAPKAMTRGFNPSETAVGAAPPSPSPTTAGEDMTQVSFHYPHPVTLADGGSLLMPIVDHPVAIERIDLYKPGTDPRHPLAAVRIRNETGAGLPPGVMTLYEQTRDASGTSFIGDARLSSLPVGESRFISFAVDQKVDIRRADRPQRSFTKASVVDGVMTLTFEERQTTVFTLSGPHDEARLVMIEHPIRPDWTLSDPREPSETTSDSLRFAVKLAAGEVRTLPITFTRPTFQRIALASLGAGQFLTFAGNGELPTSVRAAFETLANLRGTVDDTQTHINRINAERDTAAADQQRLRANLASLPEGSDLQKRTLARMGEEETDLERLGQDLATARKAADLAEAALTAYVREIKL